MLLNKEKLKGKKGKIISFLPYGRFIGFLLILLVGLLGVKLYFANLIATSGVRLTATNQRIENLQSQKEKLENEISKLGSVSRLQTQAKKIGFQAMEKIEVLSSQKPLAQRP